MNYLSVDRIAKSFGERVLFKDLSFGLSKGDKVALIAQNGTGKSSMLQIICGDDTSDEGEVVMRNGVRIGYLRQEPRFEEHFTINQVLEKSNTLFMSVLKEYEDVSNNVANQNEAEHSKALEEVTTKMDALQAWDYEDRLKQLLGKFKIHDLTQVISNLSGGQKKRLSLALVLLDNPELLILDEPTNHLDVEMIEWLEKHLGQSNITLLMVTHDRYFLDRVCNQILELHNGQLYRHDGNYSYFLMKRDEREVVMQTEIDRAKQRLKSEQEWMRRQPKARTTKSKARIDAFYDLQDKANSGYKAAELQLDIKMSRLGGKVLEMKKVYKSFGDKVILKGFDYNFTKGERVGIIGSNGCGKSTFLNMITGGMEPDSGKINPGDTIVTGYYTQEGIHLKEDMRVIETLKEVAEYITLSNGKKIGAAQFLEMFMFPPHMHYTFVSKLSGGERRRLHLLHTLIKNPNFLILDEPTNDLDLLTLERLEAFLESYGGCLVLVSHDRYFMDNLVDHMLVFRGDGEIKDFPGNYSQYREWQIDQDKKHVEMQKKAQETAAAAAKPKQNKNKISFKDKFEFETLEKEINTLETRKAELNDFLAQSDLEYSKLQAYSKELSDLGEQLDEKSFRWLELDELING
ncbi:MAG: ABC-F family ATP-binding cassette domain-containing protein [Salibacteraceae bacterium]|nr:ABC-F family ATP-binding cassette domain-containing protein [Salibacteraceae bacterium]MDP4687462.1 ABC-F family ATP-binding cassette domain-containing protein [Salibacteraceae bacterium]MDP4762697.1 ABC-F family ATP-binding cassette domain-containing protein [Salibacteraceae bacterium]MDP4843448.1 ABC-F family ATP-binding cassette domain-containing protein [Salibacteraceae bacterium]MDP4964658.1 ABC-F family ATP-binding cassette domain-containing protein [Salibacteraceae bacterium]